MCNRVTPSSGNVYADLGFPDAEEMLKKSKLLVVVRDLMKVAQVGFYPLAQMTGYEPKQMEAFLRGRTSEVTCDEIVRWIRLLTDKAIEEANR